MTRLLPQAGRFEGYGLGPVEVRAAGYGTSAQGDHLNVEPETGLGGLR